MSFLTRLLAKLTIAVLVISWALLCINIIWYGPFEGHNETLKWLIDVGFTITTVLGCLTFLVWLITKG